MAARAPRTSLADLLVRDGRRATSGRAPLARLIPECDGGVTLHFAGPDCGAVVELTAADIAEIADLAARAQAELAAWTGARSGG